MRASIPAAVPAEEGDRTTGESCAGYHLAMIETPDFPFVKGLSAPATRALNNAGYTELSQLAGVQKI